MPDIRDLFQKQRNQQWRAWNESALPSSSSGRQGQRVIPASSPNTAGGGYAQRAMDTARTLARWAAESGYTCERFDSIGEGDGPPDVIEPGRVRLCIVPDLEPYDAGDMFNPDVCPDIPPEKLERERESFFRELNRVGVWGCLAQVWTGREWETVESCWGFEGPGMYGNPEPGWEASGFADDARRAALEYLDSIREREARALEATRPDMYGVAVAA